MNAKEIKKYIRHMMLKEGRYSIISTTKRYDPLQRQAVLCEAIAEDLNENRLRVATALSELFSMDWAAQIKEMDEEDIPFGYPDYNGEWFFPTGRTYQNQEGDWFIEFEPEEE